MRNRKKRIAALKNKQAPVINAARKRKGNMERGLEEVFQESTQSGFLLGALVAVPLTLAALKGIRVWKERREQAFLRDLETEFEEYENEIDEDAAAEAEAEEEEQPLTR